MGVLNKAGKLAESEGLIRESIDALRTVHQEGAFSLARAQGMLGETLTMQGRYDEAEPLLLKSHEDVLASIKNEANWMLLESAVRLVNLYDSWHKPDKAIPFSDALAHAGATSNYVIQWAFSRGAFIPQHAALAAAGDRLKSKCGGVSFLVTRGATKADDLLPVVREYIALLADLPDSESSRILLSARLLIGFANALDPVEHNESRRLMAETALGGLQKGGGKLPLDHAEAAAVLAKCARRNGAIDEAKRFSAEAWSALAGGWPTGDWFTANQQVRIARSLLQEEMYQPAEQLLVRAYKILQVQLGDGHPDTRETLDLLRELYQVNGTPQEPGDLAPRIK